MTTTRKPEILHSIYKSGNSLLSLLVAVCLMFIMGSCGSDTETEEDQMTEDVTGTEEATDDSGLESTQSDEIRKAGKVFYTIPSPLETAMLIKKAGATYEKELLNSPGNAGNYVTNQSMALNLGVYGADLSYSSIFDQTQETMKYFAACKKLADELGITAAFGKETLDRIERSLDNRDSLVSIISDSYWETDAHLKENNRSGVSGLVVMGGWIEALYIATKISYRAKDNKQIVSRIGEQKLTLNNLIAMLELNPADDVSPVLKNLYDLKEIYDGVEMSYERQPPVTNSSTKVTTINTTSKISISEDQIKQIADKVEIIRNNIVY